MRRATVYALLALATAGCDALTGPDLPRAGAPRELLVSYGGYGYGSHDVSLRGDTLVVVRREFFRPELTTTARVVPTDAAWRRFWEAADDASVARWPRVCENRDIADGVGFGLRIVADGGETWEAQGSNAYPQANGRCSRSSEPSRDFRAFMAAISELLGRTYPA
ncbi:MAG: hypothetical protein ACXWZ7_01185 [Gemmatirosa sp.]